MAILSDYMQGYNNGYSDGLKAAKEQAATRDAPSPTPRIFADNVHVHNSIVEITCANAVKAALLAEALIAASTPKGDGND